MQLENQINFYVKVGQVCFHDVDRTVKSHCGHSEVERVSSIARTVTSKEGGQRKPPKTKP